MSQSMVTIRLNGTPYQIGCGAGEEARIEELAAEIEAVVQQLVGSVGQIGEARLLAMAALMFADRAQEASGNGVGVTAGASGDAGQGANNDAAGGDAAAAGGDAAAAGGDAAAAAALDQAAERILALASRLSSH